ncbi:hypothetical protein N9A86_02400 [Akkermansiaceae bacterium]|nr:hypothetical protein [Akkermansiaceae bacterium]
MRHRISLVAFSAFTLAAYSQDNLAVQPETNEVLESSVVLDQSTIVQGNKTLKIERLSTPDEELLKSLGKNGAGSGDFAGGSAPESNLQQKSYFISARTFDNTFTLLNFWSLDGLILSKASVWSNITTWNELASSPTFVAGDTKYTMLILPTSAQVTDDSPSFPTTLPSVIEDGAYFQEIGEEPINASYLSFLENLHAHYEAKRNDILQTHLEKVTKSQQKEEAEEQESLQGKTVTLRFWRQEDKPVEQE